MIGVTGGRHHGRIGSGGGGGGPRVSGPPSWRTGGRRVRRRAAEPRLAEGVAGGGVAGGGAASAGASRAAASAAGAGAEGGGVGATSVRTLRQSGPRRPATIGRRDAGIFLKRHHLSLQRASSHAFDSAVWSANTSTQTCRRRRPARPPYDANNSPPSSRRFVVLIMNLRNNLSLGAARLVELRHLLVGEHARLNMSCSMPCTSCDGASRGGRHRFPAVAKQLRINSIRRAAETSGAHTIAHGGTGAVGRSHAAIATAWR